MQLKCPSAHAWINKILSMHVSDYTHPVTYLFLTCVRDKNTLSSATTAHDNPDSQKGQEAWILGGVLCAVHLPGERTVFLSSIRDLVLHLSHPLQP